MRPLARIAVGLVLAACLQALLWMVMSGCSLDWSVPEATEGGGGGGAAPDAVADHSADPPVDVAPEGGEDVVVDVSFDGPMGDAVVPCTEQPTCQDCVTCVLADPGTVGTSDDCKAFGVCLVGCALWAGIGFDCWTYCADRLPVGAALRLTLNGTCIWRCAGAPPCQ